MARGVLGGRGDIEVMTGRKPLTPVKLALFNGFYMKDTVKMKTTTERVDKYCAKLERSLWRLHEVVRSAEETRLRRKSLKEVKRHPGMNFRVGDYVMV